MSNFKGHKRGAIVIASIIGMSSIIAMSFSMINEIDPIYLLISPIIAFLFALFPDLDTKSTPSKYFYRLLLIYLIVSFYYGEHYISHIIATISIIPQILKHRGILHSIFAAIILPAVVWYPFYIGIYNWYEALILYLAGVLGYITHLILDDII
jgi:membrane-bound metal-dependent hydrolase YbcI (DUF457 family)